MLFSVCILAICLNLFDYIDISWWFLVPTLIIVFIMSILELILIFREIKFSMKDKKAKNKEYN